MSAAPSRVHLTLALVVVLGVAGRLLHRDRPGDTIAAAHGAAVAAQIARVDSARQRGGEAKGGRRRGTAGDGATARAGTRTRAGRLARTRRDSAVPPAIRREQTPLGALDGATLRARERARERAQARLAAPRRRGSHLPTDPPIDLDRAGAEEIARLPWIGARLAEAIVADRRAHGPFGSLEGLQRVRGIGPSLARRLAPHVTFGESGRPSFAVHPSGAPAPRNVAPPGRPRCPAGAPFLASRPPRMVAPPVAAPEKISDQLLREGLINREQLERAQRESKSGGLSVTYYLVKLGILEEVALTKIIARASRMPAVDLAKFEVDQRILKLVPADIATKHLVLPLKRDGRTLTVAIADPTNLGILEDLKFITRYDIFPVLAGEYTLRTVIEKQYDAGEMAMSSLLADIASQDGDVEVLEDREEDVSAAALAAAVDDAPVVKLINAIMTDAVKRGASDIHFECFEHELRVRYRIDGALQEVMKPPLKLKAALISRFKIMAQLNIAERRVPQDGRIKLKMGNRVIDFRVSTLPTLFGEKVVLRILDKGNLTLELEKFGIEPRAERELMEAVSNPYGMVLVTGPTGSGKTTTLYSALSKVNNVDVNIMTAEDPVEYNLFGINQVQVRTDIGMTFAAALKAFLRQDPNIIMVGEIRDLETGGIAIKAALTGHLVLSTLHTNSAPETVTRLMDMGLEPFNVASALNLVLAQRLVRRVCSRCRVQYTPDEVELAGAKVAMTTTLRSLRFTDEALQGAKERAVPEAARQLAGITLDSTIGDLPFFKGRGCDDCAGTGLRGRQGLYEVMFMTPNLRKLVLSSVGAQEIRDAAVVEGMLTLRMDGWLKVMKGITTLEQVIRETAA